MAGTKIEVDKLGIDYIFSSLQKAWGLPAGFSIFSVSDRFRKVSNNIESKGYYFDLNIYDNIYIQPASGDAGGSLGAALAINHMYFDLDRKYNPSPAINEKTIGK